MCGCECVCKSIAAAVGSLAGMVILQALYLGTSAVRWLCLLCSNRWFESRDDWLAFCKALPVLCGSQNSGTTDKYQWRRHLRSCGAAFSEA